MIEFLIENYYSLITLLVSLISLFIFVLRRPKVEVKDTAFEKVVSLLPSLMIKAEKSIKGGSEKKSFVLSLALKYLADLLGCEITEVSQSYIERISNAIEDILSTPMKKEVKDEN